MGQLTLPLILEREALEDIFSAAHRQLRPHTPIPEIRVDFFPFAGINHTARLNQGRLMVRLSDLFGTAPAEVHEALALLLLAKLYRKRLDPSYHRRYREFVLRSEIQERARTVRTDRGRPSRVTPPQGRHVDLEVLFSRINAEYFAGTLNMPTISWTGRKSRRLLGRYDLTHDTIFISRLFDSTEVPAFVTEYIMYHEMLHIRHQTRVKEHRVIVHTHEFRQAERRFTRYEEARLWLKGI